MKQANRLILGLLLCACALLVQAQEAGFPALSGRVVDRAELLDAATEARLTQLLASYEQASGNQLVVVTVPGLQGRSIEEFGVELGRRWGIGQGFERFFDESGGGVSGSGFWMRRSVPAPDPADRLISASTSARNC